MLGIDELNVLDSSTDSAGAGMQDITNQLTLPEYNMLEGFSGDKLKEIEDKLKPLEPLFNGLAMAFAGFYSSISGFVDTSLYPWLVSIGEWMKNNPETVQNLGKFLGDVAIGLLLLKGVGALGKLFGIPQLITGIKSANAWLTDHTKIWKNVIGLAAFVVGGFMTIIGVMNIIQGKGDFMDNVRLAIAGVAVMISGYLIGSAIPAAIKAFNFFAWNSNVAMLKVAAAGKVAFLAVGLAAAAALAYILLNWDEASYKIQQGFGKIAIWINDKIAWLGGLGAKFVGGILQILTSFKFDVIKGASMLWHSLLVGAGDLIDNIVNAVAKGLGIIDQLFGTDYEQKLRNSYSSLGDAAAQEAAKAWAKIDKDREEAMAAIDADVQIDLAGWEAFAQNAEDYWTGYMATSQRMYDEALAEKARQEEEERKKQEEQNQKEMEDLQKTIEETMANLELPQIETPEIDSSITSQVEGTEEVVTNTANTNAILGETKELQTTANELATTANTMQTDFNTASLAYDDTTVKTLAAANTLQKATTNDILSAIKSVGSAITSALRNVEDACRNIKIEVHKHYGGGDGYASGGFPTSGEYFFAREDGLPEMVGRVGRQTAVMNNGQIADTMAQSLVRAMGQGGASQQPTVIENKLYLDGEVVYNNQQKIQRSKGYNLGMGVFANV